MSSLEYAHWMAFAGMEPIGPERPDFGAAVIASTLANVNRDPKRRPSPYEASDFLPFRPRSQRDEEEEVVQQLLAVFPMPQNEDA
jgi:Protein of unknown function (DUF4035)